MAYSYDQVYEVKDVFTISNKYLSNNEKSNYFTQQIIDRS